MRPTEEPIPDMEDGFSLVEVIVAMVLLGILAVGALPMFATGLRITAADASTTTATAAVSSVLEQARAKAAASPTAACQALQSYAANLPTFTDAAGRPISVTMTAPCTGGPAAVTVTVRATRTTATCDSNATTGPCVTAATTMIYVPT
ncbi:type II secretion system protein [Nocardioides sp. Kera G14]|uniref:type II secretion system protein n=1 Tax=Nocardioides sp. Kera G14 TaxID=2884264 RepID=UPI001D130201|nr:prepilin-type N-terminal cleavage/methylation domain-containing protein [Nocardioides sp. Kera G14]UDY23068.1 prepilin-type N-terminal cleavage/methylation domain-containing protein [Nocardioides sp. Kera G14]